MARNDLQMNLRVPVELKEKIEKTAFDNGRTITAEAVFRLEESFLATATTNNTSQADVKIIPLKDGKKRVIYGKLLNTLDLDYTQELSSLRDDIHLSLEVLSNSSFWNSLKFLIKTFWFIKATIILMLLIMVKKSGLADCLGSLYNQK